MPVFYYPPCRLSLLAALLAGVPVFALADAASKPEPTTFIQADEASARESDFAEARGNVIVTRDNIKVESDWARYNQPKDQLLAGDKITVHKDGDVLVGTQLDMTLGTREGDLLDPVYQMAKGAARGDAVKLIFEGPNRYTIRSGRMTTCEVGNNDWYMHSSTLDLDYNTNLGQAWNGWIEFKGTPIVYFPWMDFTLNNSRKSGLLAPTLGYNSKNGLQLLTPYYFNLAPNYDATLSPNLMTKRGLMLGGEFRYLEPDYSGVVRMEGINDKVEDKTRSSLFLQHTQQLAPHLRLDLNIQKTSDSEYLSDFGDRLSVTSQSTLPREGTLSYTGDSWSSFIRWQRFQTLSTVTNPVTAPYDRAPQIYFTAQPQLIPGLVTTASGELTEFTHPTQTEGLRTWAYPSIAAPFTESWGFITPKVGVHATSYQLHQDNQPNTNYSRVLPIASLDTGLYFERETNLFGTDMVQTLEPRAYYLYIPYRDQSNLPVFDSGETDLSLTQLFSENQFSGQDRINDANQVTLAVTSRLFEGDSGAERLNFTVGQRFYFSDQRVTLSSPGVSNTSSQRSDWLMTVSAKIWNDFSTSYAMQYNQQDSSLRRADFSMTWRPGDYKLLNLRYVNNRIANTRQADISGQWPLGNSWYAMGRYNYSLTDSRALEILGGLEYNAGCWGLRLAAQRYATSTTDTHTAFFAVLELGGIAGIGNNPLDAIRQSIPGYSNTYSPTRF
ncbi:MAG: LPS-assembly protein LptD [Formivibrio sp.]|nr:LPS-assembly protein LptD [Formivibrio sp.]